MSREIVRGLGELCRDDPERADAGIVLGEQPLTVETLAHLLDAVTVT
jgi:hypothetical protein